MKTSTSLGNVTRINLGSVDRALLVGRDEKCDVRLDSPIVSRRHACFKRQGGFLVVTDLDSRNGTYIDGRPITEEVLTATSKLQIGPYSIRLEGKDQLLISLRVGIRLDSQYLEVVVDNQKKILNDLSISIEPDTFVAIVGGSGAGKSTLLSVLCGLRSPQKGRVFINSSDLYTHYDAYRQRIGYVPQQDIVHGELTVEEVLRYTAHLRLAEPTDLEQRITETLNTVELATVSKTLVRDLSGGQRKRVCIAAELLSEPELFFLDEPTSGLDPGLDRKMMKLMKKLAISGRTVVLVTHATASVSECDRLVFLGRGGRLCYYGTPQELPGYFQLSNSNPGDFTDVYDLLTAEEAVIMQSGNFKKSNFYQHYIGQPQERLNLKQNSKVPVPGQVSPLVQWLTFCKRYGQLILRDRGNLILLLVQAPLIALILFGVTDAKALQENPLKAEIPLFILTTASLWLGVLNSIREIVKERPIFERERMVNLSVGAYLFSKVFVLSVFACIQAFSLTAIIGFHLFVSLPDPYTKAALTFGTLSLTIIASSALGLLVSAFVRSPAWAVSLAPLILVPQLMFGGVLFPSSGPVGMITQSKWSMDALGHIFELNALFNKYQTTGPGKGAAPKISVAPTNLPADVNKALKDIAKVRNMRRDLIKFPKPGYDQPLTVSWSALALFIVLFVGLAYLTLRLKPIG